jgi:hypothetical protein
MNFYRIAKETIVQGLLPGVHVDVFFPGFPTMKNLPHTVRRLVQVQLADSAILGFAQELGR